MYCTNCGNKLKEDDKFCPNCGNPLSRENKESNTKKLNTDNQNDIEGFSQYNESVEKNNKNRTKNSRTNKSNSFFNNEHFNIWSAIFGVFYYIYKGLWKKGLLLQSLVTLVIAFIQLFVPEEAPLEWISVALFATRGPVDIRRKEQDNETMWKGMPVIFNKGFFVIAITVLCFAISTILFGIAYNGTNDSNNVKNSPDENTEMAGSHSKPSDAYSEESENTEKTNGIETSETEAVETYEDDTVADDPYQTELEQFVADFEAPSSEYSLNVEDGRIIIYFILDEENRTEGDEDKIREYIEITKEVSEEVTDKVGEGVTVSLQEPFEYDYSITFVDGYPTTANEVYQDVLDQMNLN
ncbi:zinc-ribbon domain-containing protein [Tetragenococcus halophilus]|uniref:zinc-ribbon domain-containing protein n=1 Tax=Tetragenococcus halophilus TaxID=51669 RepID=UPI0030F0DB2C